MANNPLHMTFCGLEFASPIVLLSGCVGFGEEYTRVEGYSNVDVGAVCLKGTTGQMRLGNPPHRVYETPDGMLNAIGLQNPGVDRVVEEILPGLDFSETRVIANVSGSTVEPETFAIKRVSEKSSPGSISSTTRSTPGFCRPMALSMPSGVSYTRCGGLPSRICPVVPFRQTAPTSAFE